MGVRPPSIIQALASLPSLLFPSSCIACGLPGATHCQSCEEAWLQPRAGRLDSLPLIYLSKYRSESARIILAAKEDNNRTAQSILSTALDRGISHARTSGHLTSQNLLLVPIPSTKRASRNRGHFHLRTLANGMKSEFHYLELLEHSRRVKDQSNLDREERVINTAGAYRITGRYSSDPQWGEVVRKSSIILFDDLVTTGSSLREAVRALKVAKISPEIALTACAARAS